MRIADDFELHPLVLADLKRLHRELHASGELRFQETLEGYYKTFRMRFGPDALLSHDGEDLLSLVQEMTRDGMMYWLEYKNDDEFPAIFGSISGGSAAKYGFYRRRETGEWTIGTGRAAQTLTTARAVDLALRNRQQLVVASKLLDDLPAGAAPEAYLKLQQDLELQAPDIQDSIWARKYLSLIHPEKLDHVHALPQQCFHLVKLLQEPLTVKGRYVHASRFVSLSRALGWPLNHLTMVLSQRHGIWNDYWRVGTQAGDTGISFWDRMRRESIVAIGWSKLGDLSEVLADERPRESIRDRLAQQYPHNPSVTSKWAGQITNFCKKIEDGDIVLACRGKKVLGVGRVMGGYQYSSGEEFPHERPVKWIDLDPWELPTTEGLRTTVHKIWKNYDNLVAIEQRVLEPVQPGTGTSPLPPGPRPAAKWVDGGHIGRIQNLLDRKGQAILYGPPGTGKTYWAELAVRNIAALWNYGVKFDDLSGEQSQQVTGQRSDAFVRACTFHPSYGYEDFIEGFRPNVDSGSLTFALEEGIFKTVCREASKNPKRRYYLIIDEINRGDIPRIFGELLTLLDKPKRGASVLLPLSGEAFAVPKNVFVVGTMNTADRSIALLDTALRRRFGFIELMPDPSALGDAVIEGIPLGTWLTALNEKVTEHVGRDGRNLQIGHSYLMSGGHPIRDFRQFARVIQEDVLPLLEEYCYEDWDALERILGKGLVDVAKHRYKAELFEPANKPELITAILSATPDVSASTAAVEAEDASEADAAEEEDEAESEEP